MVLVRKSGVNVIDSRIAVLTSISEIRGSPLPMLPAYWWKYFSTMACRDALRVPMPRPLRTSSMRPTVSRALADISGMYLISTTWAGLAPSSWATSRLIARTSSTGALISTALRRSSAVTRTVSRPRRRLASST